jgi:hypothetical protein
MTLTPSLNLFDEIIEFLAASPPPETILAFEPPEALQQRLNELLDLNQHGRLSSQEQAELEDFLRLNRFMSRLKLRVRQRLEK